VEWETPAPLFEGLDAEFGFTLDVCATADNAKCGRYYTRADDGLAQCWDGETCWMNPPYGAELPRWMAKAHDTALGGSIVVCLVPARTDTRWWHEHVEGIAEVRALRGRVRFNGAGSAPFPSAVVIFRAANRHDLDQHETRHERNGP
jgi:site-specific DNA-methyltransferase (adenine-specific)